MRQSSPTEPSRRSSALSLVAAALSLSSLFLTALAAGPRWLGVLPLALAALGFCVAAAEQWRAPRSLSAAISLFCMLALAAEVALAALA